MPPLSSMLLQREVATLRDVDEALARQALHGGDLITNLLEVADIDEAKLLHVLGSFHNVPAWQPGQLPQAEPTAVALFPRDTALEFSVVPLQVTHDCLRAVVVEPLSPAILDDLHFSLGMRLEQLIAVPARVRFALARIYDLPPDRRDLRVIAKLEGLADPSPSEAPPPRHSEESLLAPRFSTQPLPSAASILGHSADEPLPGTSETGPAESGSAVGLDDDGGQPDAPAPRPTPLPAPLETPLPVDIVDHDALTTRLSVATPRPSFASPRMSVRPRPGRARRKGPFTLAMARDALDEADTHGGMLRVLFDFFRQYFEYAALFLVRDDIAEGVDASGPGADRDRIRGIGVPLELDGILAEARRRKLNILTIPKTEGVDAALRDDLRRPMNEDVLVVPVLIRQRVVALLYGDDGKTSVDMHEVGDVLALVPLVSAALERLILRKKLGQASSRPPSSGRSRDTLRGIQGVPGLSSPPVPVPPPDIGPLAPLPRISVPSPARFEPEEPTRGGPPRGLQLSFPAKRRITAPMAAVIPPAPAPAAAAAPAQEQIAPEEVRSTGQPAAAQSAAEPPTQAPSEQAAPPETQALSEPAPEPVQPSPAADAAQDEAAPDVLVEEVDESDDMVMAVLDELQRSPEPRPAESTDAASQEAGEENQLIVEGPRMPPKSSHPSDVGLPLVMVDVRGVAEELLESLEGGALTRAEVGRVRDELARLGEDAALVVAERFPGKIMRTPDPAEHPLRAVAEHSAVLAVASQLGRKIAAHIEPLLQSGDATKRFWAVMFLGELGGSISSRAVLSGVFDKDADVQRVARACMRTAAGRRAWVADVREKLRRIAEGAQEPLDRRVIAVNALGGLHERATVPLLLDVLEAKEQELREAAYAALLAVTCHNLAQDPATWRAWWEKNVARDRIEWLIDAVANEEDPQGASAHAELQELAGDGFGFDASQGREVRRAVAERFEAWWRDVGATRVTNPPRSPD